MENAPWSLTILRRNAGRGAGRSYHVEVRQAASDGPEHGASLHGLDLQVHKEAINITTSRSSAITAGFKNICTRVKKNSDELHLSRL